MHQFAEDSPIERRVGDALTDREETVAVAEGLTGGLVAALLTDRPGASAYLDRALVPYSYDSLRELLALDRERLDAHGVVSEPVTGDIARAARDTANATWGLATTGVAGPDGGSAETTVGTAFVGVAYAGPWGSESSTTTVARYEFDGDRAAVRERAARQALRDLLAQVDEREGADADE
ncbi:CinA family protein [Halorientalis marina]|uniref:CinA family protein n=1 Tax=Halorientalis marina TaxID=2931976 RepID=UPI001FF45C34|nr:CinA family protein [Halorientalis marina]